MRYDARLTSKAVIKATQTDVCFVPIADMVALNDGGLSGLRIMRQALVLARHCGHWRVLELHNLPQR